MQGYYQSFFVSLFETDKFDIFEMLTCYLVMSPRLEQMVMVSLSGVGVNQSR